MRTKIYSSVTVYRKTADLAQPKPLQLINKNISFSTNVAAPTSIIMSQLTASWGQSTTTTTQHQQGRASADGK
jgi:hypothetical protein